MKTDFSFDNLMPIHVSNSIFEIKSSSHELDSFFSFLYERQNIWYKRFVLQEAQPWTEDSILKIFKFTNIYRELDAGTVVAQDYIMSKFDGTTLSGQQVLFNLILYRFLNNRVSWVDQIKFVYDWVAESDDIKRRLGEYHRAGNSIFTCAHMLPPLTKVPGNTKFERLCHLLDGVWDDIPRIYDVVSKSQSMKDAFDEILKIKGYGGFLAYEIVCDLSYTSIVPWSEDEWVHCGPGCLRGLMAIFPSVTRGKTLYREIGPALVARLRNDQRGHFQRLGLSFESIAYKGQYLTLRNVEHSLCEFYKYHKTKLGTGRCKKRFVPTTVDIEDIGRLACE